MAELDNWIEIAKGCKYLPENDLKKLCDIVCDLLIEESNIQPVSTPVTVCGDIHGQVNKLRCFFLFGFCFLRMGVVKAKLQVFRILFDYKIQQSFCSLCIIY